MRIRTSDRAVAQGEGNTWRARRPWIVAAFGKRSIAFHVPDSERTLGSAALGFEVPDVAEWVRRKGFEVSEARQGPDEVYG